MTLNTVLSSFKLSLAKLKRRIQLKWHLQAETELSVTRFVGL